MAAHARLKNEFTEDEKYHLMIWLNCYGMYVVLKILSLIETKTESGEESNGEINIL